MSDTDETTKYEVMWFTTQTEVGLVLGLLGFHRWKLDPGDPEVVQRYLAIDFVRC